MKKIIALLAVLVLGSATILMAQPTPTPSTPVTANAPVSPAGQPSAEEIQQAKETLKTLLEKDGKPVDQQPAQGKTVGDVLNRGLDGLFGFATTLEGLVSKYAPEVWRIMILQQYSKAVGYPAFWGLMLLGLLGLQRIARKGFGLAKGEGVYAVKESDKARSSWKDYTNLYWARFWIAGIVPTALSIPFAIVFLYYLTESVMIVINPEYYALRDIIGMLR